MIQNNPNLNDVGLSSLQRKCPNPTNNPNCYGILTYNSKYSCADAERHGGHCKSCCHIKNNTDKHRFTRPCPNPFNIDKCRKILEYQYEFQLKNSNDKNLMCWPCSKLFNRQSKKAHNIERLLSDDLESYYWIGFLLADGHFNAKNGIFGVGLSIKDQDHLNGFAKFINYRNKILITTKTENDSGFAPSGSQYISLSLVDYINVNKICLKFDIKPRKTYEPPSIDVFKKLSDTQIKSVIAGFIDGDGTISKRGNIAFGCYFEWINILEFFATIISGDSYRVTNHPETNCKGIRIVGHEYCRQFKLDLLKFGLPILARKWNRISENILTRAQIKTHRYNRFVELYKSGMKQKYIAIEIGCDKNIICSFAKRYKLEYGIEK